MNEENNELKDDSLKPLWVILSCLGILLILGLGAYFFRQTGVSKSSVEESVSPTVSTSLNDFTPNEEPKEIDPLSKETPKENKVEEPKSSEEVDPHHILQTGDKYPGMTDGSEPKKDPIQVVETSAEVVSSTENEVYNPPQKESKTKVETLPTPASKKETPQKKAPQYIDKKVVVYWIQVGSYSSLSKAERILGVLNSKGLKATIQSKRVNNQDRYRVRIGAFGSKAEAGKFIESVHAIDGFSESFIIQSTITKRVEI